MRATVIFLINYDKSIVILIFYISRFAYQNLKFKFYRNNIVFFDKLLDKFFDISADKQIVFIAR